MCRSDTWGTGVRQRAFVDPSEDRRGVRGLRGGQKLTAKIQLDRAITVGQESEVSDLNEPGWRDVKQEATNELDRIQCHRLGTIVIFGIPPTKTHLTIFQSQ